jgi:hypothetical protein
MIKNKTASAKTIIDKKTLFQAVHLIAQVLKTKSALSRVCSGEGPQYFSKIFQSSPLIPRPPV